MNDNNVSKVQEQETNSSQGAGKKARALKKLKGRQKKGRQKAKEKLAEKNAAKNTMKNNRQKRSTPKNYIFS